MRKGEVGSLQDIEQEGGELMNGSWGKMVWGDGSWHGRKEGEEKRNDGMDGWKKGKRGREKNEKVRKYGWRKGKRKMTEIIDVCMERIK